MNPSLSLRRAAEADQERIKQIIHEANINPLGLDWQHFWLAESEGMVVGTGQIKVHGDGTRELASIAVIPSHQHQGIASLIIRTVLQDETGPVYLMCQQLHETFYNQFNFQVITTDQLPTSLRRINRAMRIFRPIAPLVGREFDVIFMRREAGSG